MNYVEHSVIRFKRKNKLNKVTYKKLLSVCHRKEYIVKSYSSGFDYMVASGVWKKAQRSNSVFVADEDGNVMIFVRDSLTADKRLFALAHELGHITLGHTKETEEAEKEADLFAHYLLEDSKNNRFEYVTLVIIVFLCMVISWLLGNWYNANITAKEIKTNNYTKSEICYFTKYSEVYHLYSDCYYLKNSKEVCTGTVDTCYKDRLCSACENRK